MEYYVYRSGPDRVNREVSYPAMEIYSDSLEGSGIDYAFDMQVDSRTNRRFDLFLSAAERDAYALHPSELFSNTAK